MPPLGSTFPGLNFIDVTQEEQKNLNDGFRQVDIREVLQAKRLFHQTAVVKIITNVFKTTLLGAGLKFSNKNGDVITGDASNNLEAIWGEFLVDLMNSMHMYGIAVVTLNEHPERGTVPAVMDPEMLSIWIRVGYDGARQYKIYPRPQATRFGVGFIVSRNVKSDAIPSKWGDEPSPAEALDGVLVFEDPGNIPQIWENNYAKLVSRVLTARDDIERCYAMEQANLAAAQAGALPLVLHQDSAKEATSSAPSVDVEMPTAAQARRMADELAAGRRQGAGAEQSEEVGPIDMTAMIARKITAPSGKQIILQKPEAPIAFYEGQAAREERISALWGVPRMSFSVIGQANALGAHGDSTRSLASVAFMNVIKGHRTRYTRIVNSLLVLAYHSKVSDELVQHARKKRRLLPDPDVVSKAATITMMIVGTAPLADVLMLHERAFIDGESASRIVAEQYDFDPKMMTGGVADEYRDANHEAIKEKNQKRLELQLASDDARAGQ